MTKLPIMLLASVFIVACGSDEKDPTPTPATTWYADTDLDTYGNPAVTQSAVDQPSGYVADNTDCDDDDMDVNPGQTEINDDKDNNCDGTINDGPYSVGDRGPAGGWVFIATSPFQICRRMRGNIRIHWNNYGHLLILEAHIGTDTCSYSHYSKKVTVRYFGWTETVYLRTWRNHLNILTRPS